MILFKYTDIQLITEKNDSFLICAGGFLGDSAIKNPTANTGLVGSIPGVGRSPGGGNDNPFQYSCLENPVDRAAWWAKAYKNLKTMSVISKIVFSFLAYYFEFLKRNIK